MTRHKFMLGLIICALSGSAYAGTAIEARVGDRDGATAGLALDAPFHVESSVSAGAVLEFGEADSVSLLGRISKSWPGRVGVYAGLGAGIAIEDRATQTLAIPPDGRHGRLYAVTEGTERDAGLALEAFAGLRGSIRSGLVWLVEASARDQEVNDGMAYTAGLRFRCGK